MIYRESAHNRFLEHLQKVRVRREGRGLMPYRAPAPSPSSLSTPEEKNEYFYSSFPPLALDRGRFALVALLLGLGGLALFSWLRAFLSRDPAILLLVLGLALGWFVFDSRRSARLVRGEVAWLRGLPFEVRGYLEALCSVPAVRDECLVRVAVTMRDEALPGWVAESIPELTPRPLKVELQKGALGFSIDGVQVKTRATRAEEPPTNLPLRDWLHECVTQILLPIDTTYRIQRVEFFVA